MSDKFPGVPQTLEFVERLKTSVGDIAKREAELERAYRLKSGSLQSDLDEATIGEEARLADEMKKANEAFEARKTHIETKYEKRSATIARAHKRAKQNLLSEVASAEGQQKYNLQKKALESTRSHDAAIAALEKTQNTFLADLAEKRTTLESLLNKSKSAFRGIANFPKQLAEANRQLSDSSPDPATDENEMARELSSQLDTANAELSAWRKRIAPYLFKFLPAWLIIVILLVAVIPVVPYLHSIGEEWVSYIHVGIPAAILAAIVAFLHLSAKRNGAPAAQNVAQALAKAGRLHDSAAKLAQSRYEEDRAALESEFEQVSGDIDQKWNKAVGEADAMRDSRPELIEQKADRIREKHESWYQDQLASLEPDRTVAYDKINHEAQNRVQVLNETRNADATKADADYKAGWETLESEWKDIIKPIYAEIAATYEATEKRFPDWSPPLWENWTPPTDLSEITRFAHLDVNITELADAVPQDPRLALPGPPEFKAPLLLNIPDSASLLIETNDAAGQSAAIGSLNNIILRLLSNAPPGRLSFTIADPVGLGENFAGVMHLADYEDHLINSRIWTQSTQIEQRLGELNEHMEKVIQMYLRNEYETITEYNEKAGTIAEKYHFLVVADFPSAFSETSIQRLLSIAAAGARCGVYTLIHWDSREPLPQDTLVEDLRNAGVWINCRKNGPLALNDSPISGANLILDPPPDPEFATNLTHRIGKASVDSNRVEVPFDQVAPNDDELWSEDTTNELTVAIGRTGATKLQYLAIGKGTCQHALIAGKTGSGKSTLFHVMITNLALWCSPDQVEFYLVDFKKGVEFKAYATAQLPHARVIAIESDREFGLSVLQRVDDELKRRGDMFRDLGVQDIAGYKKAGGTEPVPRSLLMIDEFQEFFVEDDRIAQDAAVLLDRIVRQGRAFGIHVILGSQTLGGAFTLARTTLGQMVIRIALQCNEADAYLIMDDSNPAPRMLTRPGEGIYNDQAGMMEGNSPFQVVWLPDEVRESWLAKTHDLVEKSDKKYPKPIVFEGNVPADIHENVILAGMLNGDAPPKAPPTAGRAFLGSPNSIKGPTEAVFHRQSGNNLLVVGQRDESALAIATISLVSLAAQYPKDAARFIILDASPPGSPQQEFLDQAVQSISHDLTLAKGHDVESAIAELANEMRSRAEDQTAATSAPAIFVFILGLQKFKKLRYEEDFGFSGDDAPANPGTELDNLIREGASTGIHLITTVDSFNNVNRFLSRKALTEFEMRVLFQMSANDSASLIDTPKASNLGLNRALFYNEQEGYLETFRPYALPNNDWLTTAKASLSKS
ncbi:MAG: FtsK/SpoIIIE domain-containing protein [Verrucomicrobiota bacterium]